MPHLELEENLKSNETAVENLVRTYEKRMTRTHSPSSGADIAVDMMNHAWHTANNGWLDGTTSFGPDPTLLTPLETVADVFAAMAILGEKIAEIHEPQLLVQLDLSSFAAIQHINNCIGHLVDPLSADDEFSPLSTAKDSIGNASLLAHLRFMSHIPEVHIYTGLKPQVSADNSEEFERQRTYIATLPPIQQARYLLDGLIKNATFGAIDDVATESMVTYLQLVDEHPDLFPTSLKLDILELGYVHQTLINVNFETTQYPARRDEEVMHHVRSTLERAIGFLKDKITATILPEDPNASILELA
ncbi:MAG: hypothetical protein NUV65_03750 [Candidatus Roizmanbacteria bacterium]|nr:hypothetical protein [Candidatus Roizmanbacteria bacterium]